VAIAVGCVSVCLECCCETSKQIELVFDVRVTTEDSCFVVDGGTDLPMERVTTPK